MFFIDNVLLLTVPNLQCSQPPTKSFYPEMKIHICHQMLNPLEIVKSIFHYGYIYTKTVYLSLESTCTSCLLLIAR